MSKYVDDKMYYIESDIEKIQLKTGMYISYVGKRGALHLAKELIQNAVDEAANKKSPCNKILITLDILKDSLTVEDNGRGIPETDLVLDIVCTKLQTGSKFTREQGGKTSGENGVGLTAVNALSAEFKIENHRDGKCHTLKFKEGVKVSDKTKKSNKNGLVVSYVPSKKYLGKSASIDKNSLITVVDDISYFIPSGLEIKLEIYKGFELLEKYKYKNRSLSDLLKNKLPSGNEKDWSSSMVYLSNSKKTEEEIIVVNKNEKLEGAMTRKVKRDVMIEFAFVYTNDLEPYIDSYCNFINTQGGGVHLNGVKESIWRYFTKAVTENQTEKEKEKYKILKVDVEAGLNLVVNLSTDMQMQLVGQTKNAVGNDDLLQPISELAKESLEKYFSKKENQPILNEIIKLIKLNCKGRIEAAKVKSAVIKENVNKFDKFKFDKFTACNNEGKAYKELHLCEGDSAKGSLQDGRDPDTQAFLAFRGLGANAFKRDITTILNNAEWKMYVTLLKTNFGAKFDLSKLYYDKIIIETDSDVDGYGITSIICAFHALYLPELVKAGKLYKSIAPLYHVDDKKKPFVRSKHEYVELYQDNIMKAYNVRVDDSKLKKREFSDFLVDIETHGETLIRLAKFFGVNKFLIESIAFVVLSWYDDKSIEDVSMKEMLNDEDKLDELMQVIEAEYPEMRYVGNETLRGVIDGRFQSIRLSDRFVGRIQDLSYTLNKYGWKIFIEKIKNDQKYFNNRYMSLGEFSDLISEYKPKIITRFKGLGENTSEQLWETTLNPDTRILIQLTMEDAEKSLKILQKLHGDRKEDKKARKEMMRKFKISRDDLDN